MSKNSLIFLRLLITGFGFIEEKNLNLPWFLSIGTELDYITFPSKRVILLINYLYNLKQRLTDRICNGKSGWENY